MHQKRDPWSAAAVWGRQNRSASNSARRREGADRSATVGQNDCNQATFWPFWFRGRRKGDLSPSRLGDWLPTEYLKISSVVNVIYEKNRVHSINVWSFPLTKI